MIKLVNVLTALEYINKIHPGPLPVPKITGYNDGSFNLSFKDNSYNVIISFNPASSNRVTYFGKVRVNGVTVCNCLLYQTTLDVIDWDLKTLLDYVSKAAFKNAV